MPEPEGKSFRFLLGVVSVWGHSIPLAEDNFAKIR